MRHTERQKTAMRILHSMLESDGIQTAQEFADTFYCLRYGCKVDLHPLEAQIGFTDWLTSFWAVGEQLPPREKWPEITTAVMRLLETELTKEDA